MLGAARRAALAGSAALAYAHGAPEPSIAETRPSAATLIAGAVMLAVLTGMAEAAPDFGDGALGRFLTLLVPATAGGVAYLAAALVLKAPELDVVRRLVTRGRTS